jgi:hypothetical protein
MITILRVLLCCVVLLRQGIVWAGPEHFSLGHPNGDVYWGEGDDKVLYIAIKMGKRNVGDYVKVSEGVASFVMADGRTIKLENGKLLIFGDVLLREGRIKVSSSHLNEWMNKAFGANQSVQSVLPSLIQWILENPSSELSISIGRDL